MLPTRPSYLHWAVSPPLEGKPVRRDAVPERLEELPQEGFAAPAWHRRQRDPQRNRPLRQLRAFSTPPRQRVPAQIPSQSNDRMAAKSGPEGGLCSRADPPSALILTGRQRARR